MSGSERRAVLCVESNGNPLRTWILGLLRSLLGDTGYSGLCEVLQASSSLQWMKDLICTEKSQWRVDDWCGHKEKIVPTVVPSTITTQNTPAI